MLPLLLHNQLDRFISDLSWSSLDADDIAVAFTSLSWVHIYDLGSDSESPKLVLEAPRGGGHGVVQYVLEPPGADDGSEGTAATAGPAGSGKGPSVAISLSIYNKKSTNVKGQHCGYNI